MLGGKHDFLTFLAFLDDLALIQLAATKGRVFWLIAMIHEAAKDANSLGREDWERVAKDELILHWPITCIKLVCT